MQNNSVKEILSQHCNSYSLSMPRRLQRISWCCFSLEVPFELDCASAFQLHFKGELGKTKSKLTFCSTPLNNTTKLYLCIAEKVDEQKFSKQLNKAPEILGEILLHIPKKECDFVRDQLLSLPKILFLPVESDNSSRLTAEQLLSEDLLAFTLQGKMSVPSFTAIHTAKEKMLTLMRMELKESKKTKLAYNDTIPTFWGVTLLFLAPSEKKRNFWIHGKTNLGKSFFRRSLSKRYLAGNITATSSTHVTISKQTQIVILDEFKEKNKLNFALLNLLCDNNFPFKHLYANHFYTCDAIVIVLANRSLEDTYPSELSSNEDMQEQLRNRFHQLNINECLAEQGIEPSEYLHSPHCLTKEEVQQIDMPDPIDLLSDAEIIQQYQDLKGPWQYEECTLCGSRTGFLGDCKKDIFSDIESFESAKPFANILHASNCLPEIEARPEIEIEEEEKGNGQKMEDSTTTIELERKAVALINRHEILENEIRNSNRERILELEEEYQGNRHTAANLTRDIMLRRKRNMEKNEETRDESP